MARNSLLKPVATNKKLATSSMPWQDSSLTLPWLFVNSLIFPWRRSNSTTFFEVFERSGHPVLNRYGKVDYPSARTTQRRPDRSGLLNDVFANIPSLRALFILYSIALMSPWYHDGMRPQRIGRTTRSSSPLQAGFSEPELLSSRCLLDNSTGLQTTRANSDRTQTLTGLSIHTFYCHVTPTLYFIWWFALVATCW